MATYFTTRRVDDADASEVHVGDRIIRLIEADDFPGSGPSDRRVFDIAVEGVWTGERVGRETRHSASDLPSFTSEDGTTVVVVSDQIGLTWPGSEAGALQVFLHPDWPGSYHSVNVSPRFWDKDLLPLDDIRLRAELLPDDPRSIPGVPRSGFETSCLRCYAPTDLRFSFGHAWRQGDVVFRIGTQEVIALAEGNGMTNEDGNYCAECVGARFQIELKAPKDRRYDATRNLSLRAGDELPALAKRYLELKNRVGSGMWRYGRDTFEWSLATDPAECLDRLARARAIFTSWKDQRSGFRRGKAR